MSIRKALKISLSLLLGAAIVAICAGIMFAPVPSAQAYTPGAGTLSEPNVIIDSDLPFRGEYRTVELTMSVTEPWSWCSNIMNSTHWYAFTPQESMTVHTTLETGNYQVAGLDVYTANGYGSVSLYTCSNSYMPTAYIDLSAGQTYYFRLAGYYDTGVGPYPFPDPQPDTTEKWMAFNIEEAQPSANDNFANAEEILSLPINITATLSASTLEPDEPIYSWWSVSGSVWYRYTATSSTALVIQSGTTVAIYTGTSLNDLNTVAYSFGWPIGFAPTPGTTYYIQLNRETTGPATVTLGMEVAAPPTLSFWTSPDQPARNEGINFTPNCFDPAQLGCSTTHWDFGDGTTSDSYYADHAYAADGDYTVNLSVSTIDGRSSTASQVIRVRTHDIALTSFKAPAQFDAGQKHHFELKLEALSNYAETAEVRVYKTSLVDAQPIAIMQQTILPKKATTFGFDYMFSEQDVNSDLIGFKAEIILIGQRDCNPENNTQSPSTHVVKKPLGDWTPGTGDWYRIDGELTSVGAGYNNTWLWAGSPPATVEGDLTAEFTLKLTDIDSDEWTGASGAFVFYASQPNTNWYYTTSGYLLEFRGDYWSSGMRFYRNDPWWGQTLLYSNEMSEPPSVWRIEVVGDEIRFYGDGELIFSVIDATYRNGYTGFGAYTGTKIEISNINIEAQ